MNQVLAADPLRRYTLGITIENTTLRFWYCDRATFLASDAIDFNEVRHFVFPIDVI